MGRSPLRQKCFAGANAFARSMLPVLLVIASASLGTAAAETAKTSKTAGHVETSDVAPADKVGPSTGPASDDNSYVLDGFRSAKFGMDKSAVLSAIESDFGVKAKSVKTETNPAERTTALTVAVPDLLPDGGTADVSYILGYKSKKLIQVGISWNSASDKSITPEKLYSDGEVLKSHFVSEDYVPSTVVTGSVLPGGLLLFRGEDSAGHATILILQGSFSGKKDQKELKPTSLALLYAVDPKNPDVFKVKKGQF